MPRPTLSPIFVLSMAALTLAFLVSPAWAIKQFQDQFYILYLEQDDTASDVTAYATTVREAKCNLCHLGTSRKNRNTYGIELAKRLDSKRDKGDVKKIRRAIEQVAALKSKPTDADAKTFGQLIAARQLPGAEPETAISPMDMVARADEPIRDEFSLDAAVAFLDNAALTWHDDRKCFACHSDYAFLETRPVVAWKTPIHDRLRARLEELAANPRRVSFRVTEGVMAACVLAQNDALTTGRLHPATRRALDFMWTLQSDDGGFDWIKSDQPPSEVDDHFGATMAVIGVGAAPDDYAETPAALAGLARLREYLRAHPPVNLHQRCMLLLGSLRVTGIMAEKDREELVDDLFAVQKPDGGWGIVSLGNWRRHDDKSDDTESSDGYGTGFSILVLRQAGLPTADPRIQRGIAWLKANQRVSGRWFTRSQWKDSRHYLSRYGTSYAIRALVACGEQ